MQLPARLAVCALLFALAAPLSAQSTSADAALAGRDTTPSAQVAQVAPAAPATQPQSVAGAPMTDARVAVHASETARTNAPTMAPSHANLGQSRALMVVGVAGLIVGAIIGGTPGTIIMVGGALVGLKGLYDYLQ